MRYAGLTDDTERREREHGFPRDFRVVRQFTYEHEARSWEKGMLAQGYAGDTGGAGWRYGYTFSMS
jgi:hypothetical protein